MIQFSRQLRTWRLFRGLSQSQLARRSRVPRPNLVDLESGRRDCTVTTLLRLARALDITPGRLLDETPLAYPKFDRHQIDTVARALCHPKPCLSPKLVPLYQAVYPLVFPILRSAGVVPSEEAAPKSVRYGRRQAEAQWGRENVRRIIERLNKKIGALT